MKIRIHPPSHLVWSTSEIDLDDPFQQRWLLRQTLIHGTAEDISQLNFDEVAQQLENLQLPVDIERLWRTVLKTQHD
jgi:hypothetical protein